MSKVKVYHSAGHHGYSNFIANAEIVPTIKEADVVLFAGGEDIDPSLYNDVCGKYTSFNDKRDAIEVRDFKEALKLGKPMYGTCRGLQLLTAMAGGRLIQDMDHPGGHTVINDDGETMSVNSLHHQMAYPFDMPKEDYEILASVPEQISTTHTDGQMKEMNPPMEVEAVYYPKIKAFGVQWHPEMMSYRMESDNKLLHFNWLKRKFKEKLNLDIEI